MKTLCDLSDTAEDKTNKVMDLDLLYKECDVPMVCTNPGTSRLLVFWWFEFVTEWRKRSCHKEEVVGSKR